MGGLYREILAVGTLSARNTSLTPMRPPPPLCPIPGIVSSLTHDKSLSVLQNCEVFTMGVRPRLPESASRLLSPLECDRAYSLTCTQTHAHDRTCVSMHRNNSHTHVIRHGGVGGVGFFYSVGHVSICGFTQTCSWSRSRPCFVIILGKNVFAAMILTVLSPVVCLCPSAYTETLPPGTSWSRRATS